MQLHQILLRRVMMLYITKYRVVLTVELMAMMTIRRLRRQDLPNCDYRLQVCEVCCSCWNDISLDQL